MLQDIAQQLKLEKQRACGQRNSSLEEVVLVASYANHGIKGYTNVSI